MVGVVTVRTFLEHVCETVVIRPTIARPGPDWCRRSIGDRSWLLPLGCAITLFEVLAVEGISYDM